MIGYEDCTHHQEIRSCQISTVCALKTKTYGYIWANGEFASKGWELEHQQLVNDTAVSKRGGLIELGHAKVDQGVQQLMSLVQFGRQNI